MRRLLFVFILLLVAGPAFADDRPLNRIVADYEAWVLSDDPFAAEREGDKAALARLPDVTPAADAVRKRKLHAFQARLKAVPQPSDAADGVAAALTYCMSQPIGA